MLDNSDKKETVSIETWMPPKGVILEPSEGREETYSPAEPTPADLFDPRVQEHQQAVRAQAYEIIDHWLPAHIFPELASFLEKVYLQREAIRTTKNGISFQRRVTNPAHIHDTLVLDVLDKMKISTAKTYETIAGMIAQGNAASEFKKLMHIAGYRIEFLDPARQEVFDAIDIHDGEIFTDPEEEYEIMTYDGADKTAPHIEFGLAMTRKKQLGTVGDIKIFERSSFILRVDKKAYLDPRLAEFIRNININDETKKLFHGVEIWKILILDNVDILKEIQRLLKTDDYETIIPLSTTIYGHNAVLDAEITAKELAEKKKTPASALVEIAREIANNDNTVFPEELSMSALLARTRKVE
jgi:hypothetical protein